MRCCIPPPHPKTFSMVEVDVAAGKVREPYSAAIKTSMNFPTLVHLCNQLGPGVKTAILLAILI